MRYAGKNSRLSKFDFARTMAACLCYLVLRQRDAVSLNLFDGEVRVHVPRTGNLASIRPIMESLSAFDPARGTNVASVLHQIAATQRRRGIVLLLSDLFDDEQAVLDGIRHLRFGGHEVIVFHTLDHDELEFPFSGAVEFDGLEAAGKLLTRPADIRKSYLKQLQQFRDRLREGCEQNNSHYLLADTSHPLHEVLSGYLAFRHRTN